MDNFDRLLIDPSGEEVEHAWAEAVAAVNGRRRTRLLGFPPADCQEYQSLGEGDRGGWRQWQGHWETRRPSFSEIVWTAWWTDALGRKHQRVVGERAIPMATGYYPLFSPSGSGWVPLALVHPEHTVVRWIGGRTDAVICCPCGVIGLPSQVGWMGNCCGPCYDRREEGQSPPPENEGTNALSVAWSADRRTAALLGFNNKVLHIWDVLNNSERIRLQNGTLFQHLALSPTGNLLAASGWMTNEAQVRRCQKIT